VSDEQRPLDDGIVRDFKVNLSYGRYLHLDEILHAQHPVSTPEHHDELLFILQHQTSELWLKLVLHELRAVQRQLAKDDLRPALKGLARVKHIQRTLTEQWSVLATLTPSEYAEFRSFLGTSSGFQSYQYRQIEFILGNRNVAMLRPHEHREEIHRTLVEELARPSMYDEAVRLLARSGFDVPAGSIDRDVSGSHVLDEAMVEVWRQVYDDPQRWWSQYELAEKLVDVEDYFRRWRFNHVTTVERVIGFKRGTGGTGGVSYLRRMLEIELFPDLWRVRTVL
jgi:tryptophan 2,3-dioxygenase